MCVVSTSDFCFAPQLPKKGTERETKRGGVVISHITACFFFSLSNHYHAAPRHSSTDVGVTLSASSSAVCPAPPPSTPATRRR